MGWGWEYEKPSKGFLYSNGNYMTVLPPGWLSAQVTGINNKGDVIGFGNDNISINESAFLFSGGEYTKLSSPGWSDSSAVPAFLRKG